MKSTLSTHCGVSRARLCKSQPTSIEIAQFLTSSRFILAIHDHEDENYWCHILCIRKRVGAHHRWVGSFWYLRIIGVFPFLASSHTSSVCLVFGGLEISSLFFKLRNAFWRLGFAKRILRTLVFFVGRDNLSSVLRRTQLSDLSRFQLDGGDLTVVADLDRKSVV